VDPEERLLECFVLRGEAYETEGRFETDAAFVHRDFPDFVIDLASLFV
jgi:hypothetical protein